jgi:hypothetical protein
MKFTSKHARVIVDAHEIQMDPDNEETELLDENNPELAEAYRALLALAGY